MLLWLSSVPVCDQLKRSIFHMPVGECIRWLFLWSPILLHTHHPNAVFNFGHMKLLDLRVYILRTQLMPLRFLSLWLIRILLLTFVSHLDCLYLESQPNLYTWIAPLGLLPVVHSILPLLIMHFMSAHAGVSVLNIRITIRDVDSRLLLFLVSYSFLCLLHLFTLTCHLRHYHWFSSTSFFNAFTPAMHQTKVGFLTDLSVPSSEVFDRG